MCSGSQCSLTTIRADFSGFGSKIVEHSRHLLLLTLRVDGQTSCEQVKERATAKLAEVEQKMVELQRMRQALLQVASLCEGEGPKGRCPMLDALEHEKDNGGDMNNLALLATLTCPNPHCQHQQQ